MASASPIAAAGPAPQRILIVDDSAVARAVLTRIVASNPRFAVSAAVADATSALTVLERTEVDAILLDLEMPGIDGLAALPDLLARCGKAKVLVVSASCGEGASATIQALALGAADTLVKPGAGGLAGTFATTLVDKLIHLAERSAEPAVPTAQRAALAEDFDIVAIGASTGGIHALGQVLRGLDQSFQTPILVTQHLPASFTPYFAAQLAVLGARPCDVATSHLRVRPGRIVVAPGDAHMTVVRLSDGGAAVKLSTAPAVSGCMPSVDPMFSSLAAAFGPRALAVVLSGMGRDGAAGARMIREAGGTTIVQDKATSVVWGMPGSVVAAGCADLVLPPDAIGRTIASARRPR